MDLEERVVHLEALLEKKIKEYDLQIARNRAATEIQTVLGRYSFYYTAQKFNECAKLWARRKDSSADLGFGVFEGYDSICRLYNEDSPLPLGLFRIHALTTPAIEVAEDGLTARGVWISPGIDTNPEANPEDGKVACYWCWIKYGADFIKENDKWYIWHLIAYGLFHTDYYTSWGDMPPKPLMRDPDTDDLAPKNSPGPVPDRPTIRHDWTYAVDRRPELDPVPPLPYETWEKIES